MEFGQEQYDVFWQHDKVGEIVYDGEADPGWYFRMPSEEVSIGYAYFGIKDLETIIAKIEDIEFKNKKFLAE